MSDLAEQIDALLALNAKGAVSHPVPGLAVELLTKAADALRASPAPLPVTITDEMVDRACKMHNVGWSLWHEPQKKTAREVMRAALTAALSKPGEQG